MQQCWLPRLGHGGVSSLFLGAQAIYSYSPYTYERGDREVRFVGGTLESCMLFGRKANRYDCCSPEVGSADLDVLGQLVGNLVVL